MDFLRDQLWNGIAALAAIIAILVAVRSLRDRVRFLGTRIFLTVISAAGGTAVMAFGPLLQRIAYSAFVSGFPSMLEKLRDAVVTQGDEIIVEAIVFGLFPGTVTAVAALSGHNRAQRTRRAVIAAIVSLIVYDMLSFAIAGWEQGTIRIDTFALISDFIGGAIAGYLISLFTGLFTKQYDVN